MIKHLFISAAPDDGDSAHVQGSHWNGDHVIDDPAAVRAALSLAAIATSGSASDLTSGTVPSGVLPPPVSFTGDVTSSGTVTTIASNAVTSGKIAAAAVTNAKLANMAAATLKGSIAGGVPADLSSTQVKSLLGLALVATTANAADLSGTLDVAQMPALTGAVTTSLGSVATTITAQAVTNAKLANVAANTIKGSIAGGTPSDLTPTQAKSVLAIASTDVSGLAATATSTNAANLTGTLAAAQLPALTGDVTTSVGTAATTIASHAVSYAKQTQAAAFTMAGNNTGSTADKIDMTIAQIVAMIQPSLLTITTISGGVFGDGSLGAAVFDGSTAVTGCTRSGSTYTAIQDLAFTNATFSNGVTLDLRNLTSGFELMCSGTLAGPASGTATIHCNGNAAAANIGGIALTTGSPIGVVTGGGASGVQNAGVAGGASATWQNSFKAGVGGGGGASATNAGSVGGTAGSTLTDVQASILTWQNMRLARTPNNNILAGGAGGGSGGGTTGVASGGGGGGGAGWCRIAARIITNGAQFVFSANGGAAGNGQGGNAGGGGGGGGGYTIVAHGGGSTPAGLVIGTNVTANGGPHGTPSGTGSVGVDGGAGQVRIFSLGAV